MSGRIHYSVADTAFGEIVVVWRRQDITRIVQIILPALREVLSKAYPHATRSTNAEISGVLDDIVHFLDGGDVKFDLDLLDLDSCSRFQRDVLIAEHGIPRGRISTYGRIARHIGRPRSSRAVGRALATNPFPLVIPCHRAVRSDGGLGGFQGGAGMKERLLVMEGVRVEGGRVLMRDVFY